MSITRAHGVDISKWQEVYADDGIDEGFQIDFIIQKAADGLSDYTHPNDPNYSRWWKKQRESISAFKRVGMYHWFQTELPPVAQAKVAMGVMDKEQLAQEYPYRFIAVDYESHQNVISKETARALKTYIEYIWETSEYTVLLYCNYWIYTLLNAWLGETFVNKVEYWYAGGPYYNLQRQEPIGDDKSPSLPRESNSWILWQYSADGNRLADELDFGEKEITSIDLDVYNGTPEEMDVWLGLEAPPEPPPIDECQDENILNDLRGILQKYS